MYKRQELHRYAAIISARNESAVIGRLIRTLKEQDYPSELLDVIVVADNCTCLLYTSAVEKKLPSVKDGNLLMGDCKFRWIDKLVNENVTSKKNKLLRSRFDKAATSKRWGKPIACLLYTSRCV